MDNKELKEFQDKERLEKERTEKAEQEKKAATEKENVWKAEAQKKEFENHDKAIKDNILKEQLALKAAHEKEAERVKKLNESAKEKPQEKHYNPVFDRAGIEREQWRRQQREQQQQKQQQQQKAPRQPHHHDRQGEDWQTRELNTIKQIMCKKEATRRLDGMTPEQRDALKDKFESEMAMTGDNRKLTDHGLHQKLSEKIMDDKGVPRQDAIDLIGIAAGMSRGNRRVYQDDVLRAQEARWYKPAEKTPASGKEMPKSDHDSPKDGPQGPDKGGPDRPGPAPAHGQGHMPWDKERQAKAGLSKDAWQDLGHGQGKPWQQRADPDREESRMAAQARDREQERDR